jgi:hypothetical protein
MSNLRILHPIPLRPVRRLCATVACPDGRTLAVEADNLDDLCRAAHDLGGPTADIVDVVVRSLAVA